jgi:hypothetical protein
VDTGGPGSNAIFGLFEPGKSPFRIKGTAYTGLFQSFDVLIPGGWASVAAAFEDPRVVEFFKQPFLPSSMYDVFPILEADRVAGRLAGKPWRSIARESAVYQVERDLGGVYRGLLKLASARMVVERSPRILMQYLDFGSIEGELVGTTRYEGLISGIPRPASLWLHTCVEAFVLTLFAAAGTHDASVIVHPFQYEGDRDGMEMTRARLSISWV